MPRERNLRKDLPKSKASKKSTATKPQKTSLLPQQQAKKPSANAASNKHRKIQQSMLNAFSDSFSHHAQSTTLIQELKQHLFNRDFLAAFSRPDLLEAYALRWSPSRALAYFDLFCSCEVLADALEDLFLRRPAARRRLKDNDVPPIDRNGTSSDRGSQRPSSLGPDDHALLSDEGTDDPGLAGSEVKVMCLGAGSGAEVVAFAGYLHWLRYGDSQDDGLPTGWDDEDPPPALKPLTLQTVDIADWSSVVDRLVSNMTSSPLPESSFEPALSPLPPSPPPLTSKTKSPHIITYPSYFRAPFSQQDILSPDSSERLVSSLASCALVTLMFTLNELYAASLSRTTAFLLTLTSAMRAGSLLLVVDSPGSYSTVKLNRRVEDGEGEGVGSTGARERMLEEKRYPMQWLLDHTLIQSSSSSSSSSTNVGGRKSVREAGGEKRQWEKIHSQDSRWFRLPKGLAYPIELEDMRYQVHLYEKL